MGVHRVARRLHWSPRHRLRERYTVLTTIVPAIRCERVRPNAVYRNGPLGVLFDFNKSPDRFTVKPNGYARAAPASRRLINKGICTTIQLFSEISF